MGQGDAELVPHPTEDFHTSGPPTQPSITGIVFSNSVSGDFLLGYVNSGWFELETIRLNSI